ncbi:ABC transporter substrate-binding protein [Herminiimonas sp.]|uniref:ABC transporter substrate-binding protein n=1 Tax=Herminiimonas sp. TaxID=1926289 RepID=UPI00271AEE00|nr:ABC transporter substrate-binding protein [Herminiimonas sp.]MDO8305763.1 ABC transporter substrate-binding protein [Herminiimonas sp.]
MLDFLRTFIVGLVLIHFSCHVYAEDGVTDNKIVIGQTVGLTGTIAAPVKEMNEGANAYIASVNSRGGVNGRKIELLTLDDKFDAKLAAVNAELLIKKEHVFALFQNRGTPLTEAITPILSANKIPLIAPSTGATVFHAPVHPLLFNVRAKYQDEVRKGVEHFTTIGATKIGLLHVDDSFGKDGLAGFVSAMNERSMIPATITSFPRVKPDYAATADAIVKANPNALIIVSSSANTVAVIKAIREKGSMVQIMTLSNNSSQSFVQDLGAAGTGIIVSQITPAPNSMTTGLGKEFMAIAKASNTTVSYAAMEGFVAAKVLVEGLKRAGRNLTREGFVRALESMQKFDLGGLMISYTANDHTGSEFVELTMISKDGRFIR